MPVVKETDLSKLPCPLMDEEESIFYTIALSVLKRGILKSFEGNPLLISKLRDYYVQLWDDYWVSVHGEKAKEQLTGPYWAGPRMAITVANKIQTFLNKYEIVVPLQPYSYALETYTIQGTNSIVKSKVGRDRPWLSLNMVPEHSGQGYPALDHLAKWYNTNINNTQSLPTGIIILPLIKGKIHTLPIQNITMAKDWILQGIQAKGLMFPIIGNHCNKCKSKRCTEVTNVGQHEDSRVRWLRQISSQR